MKVLFIEDDEVFEKVYATKLESMGYEVERIDNGAEAISHIKSSLPDCIILDVMLKGKENGFDVLETITHDEGTKSIPVIVLTNLDSEEKTAKEIGAKYYFVKVKTNPAEIADCVNILTNNI